LIRDPASGEKPTVFTCAGDEAARSTVIALAKEIGFEGVDGGSRPAARHSVRAALQSQAPRSYQCLHELSKLVDQLNSASFADGHIRYLRILGVAG
jgi:hypothetical protein